MMSFVQTILARILALTDAVLAVYTNTPTEIAGSGCASGAINVSLNDCGTALVAELQGLTFGGVAFLNGILAALGAGNY
jgi:hypothetical protein